MLLRGARVEVEGTPLGVSVSSWETGRVSGDPLARPAITGRTEVGFLCLV